MDSSNATRPRRIGVLAGLLITTMLTLSAPAVQAASLSKLAKANGKKFAELIAKSSSRDMRDLWETKNRRKRPSIMKICHADRVKAINEYISTKGAKKFNPAQMKNAVYFLQIAYYHNAYHPRDLGYSKAVTEESCKALAVLGNNRKFLASDAATQDLRVQWGVSIDSTGALPYCIPAMTKLINRYVKNPKLGKIEKENTALIKVMYSIGRQGNIRANQRQDSKWYKGFEGQGMKSLAKLALMKKYKEGGANVVQNALWNIGKGMTRLSPKTKRAAHNIVSKGYKTHRKKSGPWVWAGKTLVQYFGSKTNKGKKVSKKAIEEAQLFELFPKTYKYQKGNVILRCSLSKKRADHLGKALELVRKEFFKHCPHKRPVRGDKNKVITIFIYPSPKSYKTIHPGLFNTSVQNGGIFIESRGHIYTFDREVPRQNIYNLEELVRHEYTHYLDSRYNLWGGFNGRGTVFKKAPIAWYLEGLAEAMTGATPGKGILPRAKMVKDVRRPMSLARLTRCTYEKDGFSFYSDGALFFTFLANKKPEMLKKMFKILRSNDGKKIRALFNKIATDSELQTEYTDYYNYLRKAYRNREKIFFEDFVKLT